MTKKTFRLHEDDEEFVKALVDSDKHPFDNESEVFREGIECLKDQYSLPSEFRKIE